MTTHAEQIATLKQQILDIEQADARAAAARHLREQLSALTKPFNDLTRRCHAAIEAGTLDDLLANQDTESIARLALAAALQIVGIERLAPFEAKPSGFRLAAEVETLDELREKLAALEANTEED